MAITVTIKISGGDTFTLEVELSMTVLDLKQKCVDNAGVEAAKQRLIFKGRILKDEETLESLNLQEGNTVHLVRSGTKPTTTTTTQSSATSTPSPDFGAMPAGSGGAQGNFTSNPFSPDFMSQMLSGMSTGMPSGVPGAVPGTVPGAVPGTVPGAIPGAVPGAVPDLNPQAAAALLNSPMIQEMMNQICNNPQLLRSLVESNPILQPMMQQNPMFSQMINNPELVRTLMRPGMLQAGLQMHQAMQHAAASGNPTAASTMPQNPEGAMLNPLFGAAFPFVPTAATQGSMNYTATMGSGTTDDRPPQERFATQLQVLQEMGFSDTQENISVLTAVGGDINAAITRLLDSRGNFGN